MSDPDPEPTGPALRPTPTPQPADGVAEPHEARVATHLRCFACGYDLISLPASGKCPECARPVRDSLDPDGVRFRDPAWLGTLAEAMTWQLVASVIAVLLDSFELFDWAPWSSGGHTDQEQAFRTGLLVWLAYVGAEFWATWRLTVRGPATAEPPVSLRRALRAGSVLSLASLLVFNLPAAYLPFIDPDALTPHAWAAFWLGTQLTAVATTVLWYTYVRRLARRLAAPALALEGLYLMVAAAFSGLALSVYPALQYAAIVFFDVDLFSPRGALAYYASLAIALWGLSFVYRLRRLFRAASASVPDAAGQGPETRKESE
jgi:hypothetical protein